MEITMATLKSDQVTKLDPAAGTRTKFLKPVELAGRERAGYFSFTVPVGNAAVNDIVQLVKLPKGARILDFHLVFEAMSTGGGTAQADIGLDGNDRYLTALSVDGAGQKRADGVIDVLPDAVDLATEPTFFTATVKGEAWLAGQKFQGRVEWVHD